MTTPPRGWYPDPSDPDKKIYWDGTAWAAAPAAAYPDVAALGPEQAASAQPPAPQWKPAPPPPAPAPPSPAPAPFTVAATAPEPAPSMRPPDTSKPPAPPAPPVPQAATDPSASPAESAGGFSAEPAGAVYPAPPAKHVESGNSGIRRIAPWVAGIAAVGAAFAGGIWVAPQLTGGNQNNDTQPSNTATSKAAPTTSGAVSSPTTSTTTQPPATTGSATGVFGPFDSGDAKVFVDGKPREVRGKVTCSEISGDFYIGIGPPGNQILVMLSRDLSRVLQVNLGTVNGTALPVFLDGAPSGDAAVVKDGNSYRITGNIATGYSPTDPTVPFGIDATCP